MDDPQELTGGTMTSVVRIGDTVRRAPGRWTPAVHTLLDHLASVGFAGVPRVLGFDSEGREILTYLPSDPVPATGDDAVAAAGSLIRRLHDALASYEPRPGSVWRIPGTGPLGHNDLSPVNTVYAEGVPYGFIDWDLAGPAPPGHDLAWAAVNFVPLRPDHFCLNNGFTEVPDRPYRLRRFCDAYGVEQAEPLLDAIDDYLTTNIRRIGEEGPASVSPYATFLANDEDRYLTFDLEWFRANRPALAQALTTGSARPPS